MTTRVMTLLALTVLAAGCDSHRGMQVRTYPLHRMSYSDAETLLTPYIGDGGFIGGKGRLVTVREVPDQLDSIAALLKRYDGAPVPVTLHFQVIEAGDFDGGDSAIARVEGPLREMFRYRGYRLLKDMTVQTMEGTPFSQSDSEVRVAGSVREVTPSGPDAGVTVEVEVTTRDGSVGTAVSGAPGKTLVIGSQKRSGGGALILAVQPSVR